jgi:hypothetical protein
MNVPRNHTASPVIAVLWHIERPTPFMFLWKRTLQRCYIRIYSEHSLTVFVCCFLLDAEVNTLTGAFKA